MSFVHHVRLLQAREGEEEGEGEVWLQSIPIQSNPQSMGKDSGTKCSHCGKNGHNSRTCDKTVKTVKLFGVKISQNKREDPMKKSFSMDNLQAVLSEAAGDANRGYLSDTPAAAARPTKDSHERKKGVPWTIEEHRTFLEGLKRLGKGDWRGISRSFVTTRTPTQVASHAQKYFLRQGAATKKKRRSSLFDMPTGETSANRPLPVKETNNFPAQLQKGPLVQVADRAVSDGMQGSQIVPMAKTQNVPLFNGIGYMVGMRSGQIAYVKPEGFPAVSVVPIVNTRNVGYVYQFKHPNNLTAYAPVVSQTYLNPFSPPAAPQCAPRAEPHGLSTVNTDLKLSIAQPGVSDRAKIPSHASNMNGAIGVI